MTQSLDIALSVTLSAIMISGCASVPRATEGGVLKDFWTKISTGDVIRVRGVGAAPAGAKGQTHRRAASRNAALSMARYELLATVRGIKISGGVTLAQLAERDSLIRELANDIVKGGEEILTEFLADDGAVCTLELKRSTVERLINEKSQREKDLEKRLGWQTLAVLDLKEQLQEAKAPRENEGQSTADLEVIEPQSSVQNAATCEPCWNPLSHCYWTRGQCQGD